MHSDLDGMLAESNADSLSSILEVVNRIDAIGNLDFGEPVRIAVVRNYVIDALETYLKYHLYRAALRSDVRFGDYDTVFQEVLTDAFRADGYEPDIIVLSLMLPQFEPDYEVRDWEVDDVAERLCGLFDMVASRTDALVVVNTFLRPFPCACGIASTGSKPGLTYRVGLLNQRIRDYVGNHAGQFFVVDWELLVMQAGDSACIDRRFWYMAKAPFKPAFLKLYAAEIIKIGRALKGRTKKCVVLDCDNTLWGNVIGEDGLDGIQLDRNEFPGNTYYDFQKSIIQLVHRGVLVAVCSRNNEADVFDVLDNHPFCLLKRTHVAAHRINWRNKVDNLSELANELNLALDSFVFVDDSDFECGLVSRYLPEVTVRQVPHQLHKLPRLLLEEGLFDSLTWSEEDRHRTAMVQAEQRRQHARSQFHDLDAYLALLNLKATIHPARESEFTRVAQLTQKTNQFNLTSRRYSEQQIRRLAANDAVRVFTLSVTDKYGDSGLTGILIAKREGERGRIDTFLLSCRILGRNLELAFVRHCLHELNRTWRPAEWLAEYIPAEKNAQVADFWEKIGFTVDPPRAQSKRYRMRPAAAIIDPVTAIEIVSG